MTTVSRHCLWCLAPVPAASPRICSRNCFNAAKHFGWWSPKRLWLKREVDALIAMEDAG